MPWKIVRIKNFRIQITVEATAMLDLSNPWITELGRHLRELTFRHCILSLISLGIPPSKVFFFFPPPGIFVALNLTGFTFPQLHLHLTFPKRARGREPCQGYAPLKNQNLFVFSQTDPGSGQRNAYILTCLVFALIKLFKDYMCGKS